MQIPGLKPWATSVSKPDPDSQHSGRWIAGTADNQPAAPYPPCTVYGILLRTLIPDP